MNPPYFSMADYMDMVWSGGENGGALFTLSINDELIFTSTGSAPDNLSFSPTSGTFTFDGQLINFTIRPQTELITSDPEKWWQIRWYGNINWGGTGVPARDYDASKGYSIRIRYTNGDPPTYGNTLRYYLVNVSTTLFGNTFTYNNIPLYVTDSTIFDECVGTYDPNDLTPIRTMFDKSRIRGGTSYPTGVRMVSTGEEIVPSTAGEAMGYFFGYPTTSTVYATDSSRITFASGTQYLLSQLYYSSDIVLSNVTFNNLENISTGFSYYLGYENIPSENGSAYKKLDGSTYSYVRPSGINRFTLTSSMLDKWRTIISTENYYSTDPVPIPPSPGPAPGEDPYSRGGESEEGGGTGTFDNTSEPIPVPDLPTTSAVETGFISLYKPSLTQLRALATYLWSANGLDLNTFKRIFSDPISAILGLSLVPIDPGLGNDVPVVLGNINTGVTMSRILQQYQKFNCGTLAIQEYWGGYLDYSPYTRAEIYLPFIGVKPLNIDDIMGKTISLWYVVDFLSGGCVACLECGGSVLYQFIGQCACSIPITGNDMTNVINGILSVVGAGVGAMVATGGVGLAGLAATGSLASNVMGMKTHVEKSGSMGGMGGMLGVKTPYIILTRPRQALPASQNKFTGYPSFITTTLGACEGYTVVHEIHLEGLSATDDEKREIDQLLKGGVIL